jgi:O-antigen/teichoic acid export membrane protein
MCALNAGPASPAIARNGNTETIARNTAWYGLEVVIGMATAFATSIAIARAMGPQRLGYFQYIFWLANISAAIGSLGVPATARKYMAEYFGRGEPGIARAIYETTLRLHMLTAGLITTVGLILVFTVSNRDYRVSSAICVASVFPGMLTAIPAQANIAAENLRANVPSGLTSSVIYVVFVGLALAFGWGLPGIAMAFLLSRSTEVIWRLHSVGKWIRTLPQAPLPDTLRARMWTFSGFSTVLMVLQVVVWDRSDIVLLKMFSNSIQEITFYSVAINLTEKVLLLPSAFGGAIGVSVMAQYGRNPDALRSLVPRAARYMFLFGAPALLGLALLSRPLIETLYGHPYLPVIPVLFCAACLAIPKTMLLPVQQLLLAAEQQRFLVLWGCLCGAVNIGIDLALIPRHGALGAAIGNGVGQALAVAGMWARAGKLFRLDLPWRELTEAAGCACGMAAAIFGATQMCSGWRALVVGALAGGLTFALLLRAFGLLTQADLSRISRITTKTPPPIGLCLDRLLRALSREGKTSDEEAPASPGPVATPGLTRTQ